MSIISKIDQNRKSGTRKAKDRPEKLEAALRANLKRRKQQARARSGAQPESKRQDG